MKEVARIFTGKKILDLPALNKMGLQVWRIKMANWRRNLRSVPSYNNVYEDDIRFFDDNGAIIKKNFLSAERYEKIKAEAERALQQDAHLGKENYFGNNKKILLNILDLDEASYPELYALMGSEHITTLFRCASRKPLDFTKKGNQALAQIEFLVQGDDSAEDVETQIHSDVFYSSNKAWLYLNDIHMNDGPLTYFMKSRKNDKLKLKYEYENSIKENPDKSRRITQEELSERGLEETVMNVEGNTLVMADVNGYHRRLKGEEGKERLAIIFRERGTPF